MFFLFYMKCMKNMNIGGRNVVVYICLRFFIFNFEFNFLINLIFWLRKKNCYI